MKIFIQALDYNLWSIIVNGPHILPHTINNIVTLKSELDWDDNDKRMTKLNTKDVNVLYYILDINEFNRILTCISIKEIWDKLEVTYEDTNQVKETKINMLVYMYELFQMEQNESISSMFTHFIDMINGLKCLGKIYTNSNLVKKVLNTYPLDELLGSLMTHELSMH